MTLCDYIIAHITPPPPAHKTKRPVSTKRPRICSRCDADLRRLHIDRLCQRHHRGC